MKPDGYVDELSSKILYDYTKLPFLLDVGIKVNQAFL